MKSDILYRKNNNGEINFWHIALLDNHQIQTNHGVLGKSNICQTYDVGTINGLTEFNSKVKDKRRIGYKRLDEVKDNTSIPVGEEAIINYLKTYLPNKRISDKGFSLPMLAKSFDTENSKLFNKIPTFYSQSKINGERCIVTATKENASMFKPIRLEFTSRYGTKWNLEHLEDDLLDKLADSELLDIMVEEEVALDGELYLPGYTINEINSFIKNTNTIEHKLLQFWCFDIAIDDIYYQSRMEFRYDQLHKFIKIFNTKEDHLNNKSTLVCLVDDIITDFNEAFNFRNNVIDLGFEGAIFRNPNSDYQFGKRNSAMFKFKRFTDGKFKIVDIKPEGNKRSNLPLFTLRNDINSELFNCSLRGSHSYQESILANKDKYIGKYMFVEYGERSGISQVPFHIKMTKLIEE